MLIPRIAQVTVCGTRCMVLWSATNRGHAHFVALLTHKTTDRFKTSRSIRSWAFSARNRFKLRNIIGRKPLRAFVFGTILGNPVTQGARVGTQVAGYLGDRLAGLTDDADSTLPKLRVELPSRLWHDYSS
jgi:hypothetical protein